MLRSLRRLQCPCGRAPRPPARTAIPRVRSLSPPRMCTGSTSQGCDNSEDIPGRWRSRCVIQHGHAREQHLVAYDWTPIAAWCAQATPTEVAYPRLMGWYTLLLSYTSFFFSTRRHQPERLTQVRAAKCPLCGAGDLRSRCCLCRRRCGGGPDRDRHRGHAEDQGPPQAAIGMARVVGGRLRRAPKAAGLTQAQVARALGKDQSAVSRIEQGQLHQPC
jgi:hypothetical protein